MTTAGVQAPARPRAIALCTSSPVRYGSHFEVALFACPGLGAVTLAILFGLFNLISGATLITMGIDIRRAGRALDPVLPKAA
jgi:hypothetical protein